MAGGQQIDSGQGSVTQSADVPASGQESVLGAGTIIADAGNGVAMTGDVSTSAAGTASPVGLVSLKSRKVGGGSAVSVLLGGSGTVANGTVASGPQLPVVGALLSGSAGSVGRARSITATGLSFSASQGSLTAQGLPALSSATIQPSGTVITLLFTQSVQIGSGGNGGIVVGMSGGASAATYASGSGSNTLTYSLARTINSGETGTIAYTQPGNGIESVSAGNDVASFSGVVVVNNSTAGSAVANPIESTRRIDWSTAGVEGDIPYRTSVFATIAPYTGTAGTINTAITNCSNAGGGVVQLQAGNYILSTTLQMKSNVTLRGVGMSTILRFTGVGGSGFFFGGGSTCVIFQGFFDSSGYSGSAGTPQQGGAAAATRISWTGCNGVSGSYPKDATVINLASPPTGLAVGDMLTLWQSDENPATIPKNGFFVSPKQDQSNSTATGVNWQGSNGAGSCMQQRVRVVSISGNNVTIWPGLFHPTGSWKTANNPRTAWHGGDIRMAGVEDLLIDANTSGPTNQWSTVQFWQASNCWLARCGVMPKTGAFRAGNTTQMAVQMFESRNITIRSNWIDRAVGGGQGSTTTYGIAPVLASHCLVENNVLNQIESPMLIHNGALGNVYAYNYEIHDSAHEGGIQFHETGIAFNLFEGNEAFKGFGDLFHGPSNFNTFFRTHTFGGDIGFDFQAYHRYMNVVGCVISATSGYQTTSSDASLFDRWSGYSFRLGYNGQSASINNFYNGAPNIGVAHDPQVAATLMRWGNYTAYDGLTRYTASEVPSAEAFFPNTVPSTNTLPSSMYRTTRPSYFTISGVGTVAWPPIGPDVTGGTAEGGRVHKLPAQVLYEAAAGSVSSFNPSLYG